MPAGLEVSAACYPQQPESVCDMAPMFVVVKMGGAQVIYECLHDD